jgi:hypothetical protein
MYVAIQTSRPSDHTSEEASLPCENRKSNWLTFIPLPAQELRRILFSSLKLDGASILAEASVYRY